MPNTAIQSPNRKKILVFFRDATGAGSGAASRFRGEKTEPDLSAISEGEDGAGLERSQRGRRDRANRQSRDARRAIPSREKKQLRESGAFFCEELRPRNVGFVLQGDDSGCGVQ